MWKPDRLTCCTHFSVTVQRGVAFLGAFGGLHGGKAFHICAYHTNLPLPAMKHNRTVHSSSYLEHGFGLLGLLVPYGTDPHV